MVKGNAGCFKGPKRGDYSFKLGGLLLLVAALLLCSVPAAGAAEETVPAAPNAKTAPCKGLKPFNNIDELLYQFYINLDSDCLFKMPVEELEKVWGIKILNCQKMTAAACSALRDSNNFYGKPYKSERDAFYVEIKKNHYTGKIEFITVVTKAYYNQHATLFPNGSFPRLIPRPLERGISLMRGDPFAFPELGYPFLGHKPKNIGVYCENDSFEYYWLNSDKTRLIRLRGESGRVSGFDVIDHVEPYYLNKAN